jgi:cell division inhibitor SulA
MSRSLPPDQTQAYVSHRAGQPAECDEDDRDAGRAASTISEIVFSSNSPVATIRAQLLLLLFAQAIHAHSSTAMIPVTATTMTVTLASEWILLA